MIYLLHTLSRKFVGNKGEGRISKWVFQENKARQIFRKLNISYSLIRTHTCALKGQLYLSKPAGQVCFRQETDI